MPLLPSPGDLLNTVGAAFDAIPNLNTPTEIPGFGAPAINTTYGKDAVLKRNMVRWFVPETGIIEMYINPQAITYQYKKSITAPRTRGGFALQYWGEELGSLAITGTTGSSGVEGINVLYDIYRAEQNAFDPYALAIASANDIEGDIIGSTFESFLGQNGSILDSISGNVSNLVSNAIESGSPTTTRSKPTLASLAFSVEMYWSGWVFRGFFEDFRVEESADRLGLFNYSMNFKVTQRRGYRANFLAWHRDPRKGPSNSDPEFGAPYSYSTLVSEYATPRTLTTDNDIVTLSDVLQSGGSLIDSTLGATTDFVTSIF